MPPPIVKKALDDAEAAILAGHANFDTTDKLTLAQWKKDYPGDMTLLAADGTVFSDGLRAFLSIAWDVWNCTPNGP